MLPSGCCQWLLSGSREQRAPGSLATGAPHRVLSRRSLGSFACLSACNLVSPASSYPAAILVEMLRHSLVGGKGRMV